VKLFFDLAKQERWHRLEWEKCLEGAAAAQSQVVLASSRHEADFVIIPSSPQLNSTLSEIFQRARDEEITWDCGDHPAGVYPGFYSSLSHQIFSPAIHRSFCYPIVYNEQVQHFNKDDAKLLYSFVGGITSALRSRLVAQLTNHPLRLRGMIRVQSGSWGAVFDRSGVAIKREFAESLRKARFILCPRGNGVGTIRLFEAMQAGRVPVIISDDYVLPNGVDWKSCAIVVRESESGKIPEILATRESDWETMAAMARRCWEQHFSQDSLLTEMALHLVAMDSAAKMGARVHTAALLTVWTKYKAKSLLRKLQRRRPPSD
jgi:Exostosin family